MTFTEFQRRFKASKKDRGFLPVDFNQRVEASLSVQIHSIGARPKYVVAGQTVTPETYNKKFDDLFRNRLLNRHPNEDEAAYNFRLSIFSPMAKELFDRFMNMCKGAIMQPNNYSITLDDNTAEYVTGQMINDSIVDCMEFIMTNPKGYMAVYQRKPDESMDVDMKPEIEMVAPEKVIMLDSESVAFYDDKDIVFMDREGQTIWMNYAKSNESIFTPTNFTKIPFWSIENNFVTPFVAQAEQLVRNLSDDEVMVKHYSFPVKQMLVPACGSCTGTGHVSAQNELGQFHLVPCTVCNGTGNLMSTNPGEHYQLSTEQFAKFGNVMPDMAKFITPDSSIIEMHMNRWIKFYELAEKSLYLNKKINATESGEAKREDRKDQYIFLMSISNFIFDNIKKALTYVSAFRNYTTTGGYEAKEITVVAPKQFDLMTDSDLINEFATVQTKTDDVQMLGELGYMVNSRVFRDDPVQSKINEVLYYSDALYGLSGQALRNKLLSGSYDAKDKYIHDRGYKVLVNMARAKTAAVFAEMDTEVLITEFEATISQLVPSGIYEQNI